MNLPFYIAKRYFKSKKSKNIIHLISKISVAGIFVSTAALVILLSAFNGIEQMVTKLYTDFDSDLTIRSDKGKTFNQNFLNFKEIEKVEGITNYTKAVEEVVILKHQKKYVNAELIGVDTNFLSMANVKKHLVDGEAKFFSNNQPQALFGAGLLDKLDGYIPQRFTKETILFHVPLREGKLRPGKSPMSKKIINAGGRITYNREVDNQIVLVPLSLGVELLNYKDDITAVYLSVDSTKNINAVKSNLQNVLPKDFSVKTNFEKNELIFKTSKSERLIVLIILLFVFILSSFNLVACITMLYVEKKKDIKTLYSMGVEKKAIFNIFFYEGLLISGKGIVLGLVLGYAICFIQVYFHPIEMPNSGGQHFPISPTVKDAFLILGAVSTLGVLSSYLPTKFLLRKHNVNFFFKK
ncbi:MAG: FtsX-like permease family protein [Lishizhenia sp.]